MEPPLLQRLHQDHRRLALLLQALEAQGQACSQGARGAHLDQLMAVVDYIVEYPDNVHHPLEDRIFAELQQKSLTAEEAQVLADNVAQHAKLTAATSKLSADIDTLIGGPAQGLAELQQHVGQYVELQRQHMRNEEERVFPLALRKFSDTDWEGLEALDEQTHDPLFERRLSRYESLSEYALESA